MYNLKNKIMEEGNKVYIADDSCYYSQGVADGIKLIGIITKIDDNAGNWHNYHVKWSDFSKNCYRKEDLIPVIDKEYENDLFNAISRL